MTICKIFTEKPKTSDPLKHASTEAHTALKEHGNLWQKQRNNRNGLITRLHVDDSIWVKSFQMK